MFPKYGIIDRELNLKELKIKKTIDYFKITTYYSDGVVAETIRHTREGLSACLQSIWKEEDVVRFTVEEKVAA